MIKSKIQPTPLTDLRPHLVRNTSVLAGWVCPGGAYFKGGSSWAHDLLAAKITGLENGTPELECEGWVRLTDYGHPVLTGRHMLMQSQKDTLFDLANLFRETEFGKRLLWAIDNEVDDD